MTGGGMNRIPKLADDTKIFDELKRWNIIINRKKISRCFIAVVLTQL